MSYVNFNRALTRAQIEALGTTGHDAAVNGKIYFAKEGGIYVGNSTGTAELKAEPNAILEKTWDPYTCSVNDTPNGYLAFFKIKHISDNWYEPWSVRYKLIVKTSRDECQGEFDCYMGAAGSQYPYAIFNKIYSTSYYPIYYHTLYWQNTKAMFDTYHSDNPYMIGVRVQSAYSPTTVSRTFTVKILEISGCEVELFESIKKRSEFFDASKYVATDYNATSNGLIETGDADTLPYNLMDNYGNYLIHSLATPVYRYKICGWDDQGRVVPCNITDRTSSSFGALTPCPVPMKVSRGLVLYNSATNLTTETARTNNASLRYFSSYLNYGSYNFSENPGMNNLLYFKGFYNKTTDEFTLDTSSSTSYYKFQEQGTEASIENGFEEGYFYWLIGSTQNTAGVYTKYIDNPLYYFDGTNLILASSYVSLDPSGKYTLLSQFTKRSTTDGLIEASHAKIKSALGNSLVWNQMVQNGNNVSFDIDNTSGSGVSYAYISYPTLVNVDFQIKGHTYFYWLDVEFDSEDTWDDFYISESQFNTWHKGYTTWVYPQSAGSPSATGGFRIKALPVGKHISGTLTFWQVDLTLMFGRGREPSAEEFIKLYSNNYFEHNNGTLTNNVVSEIHSYNTNNNDYACLDLNNLTGPLKSAGAVCDEAIFDDSGDYQNGTLVTRVGTRTLNGTETYNIAGTNYIKSDATDAYISQNYYNVQDGAAVTCSHLSAVSAAIWQTVGYPNSIQLNSGNQIHLNIANSLTGIVPGTDTIATAKQKIASYIASQYNNNTPIIINYPITPVETSIDFASSSEDIKLEYNCWSDGYEEIDPNNRIECSAFKGVIEYTHTGSHETSINTFKAVFNETSYNDIYNAVNGGKIVVCQYFNDNYLIVDNYGYLDVQIPYTGYDTSSDENAYIFQTVQNLIDISNIDSSDSTDDSGYYLITVTVGYDEVLGTIWDESIKPLGVLTSVPIGDAEDPDNSWYTKTQVDNKLLAKQNTLVSGTNIKTVGGQSILGPGNIDVGGTFYAVYGTTTYAQVLAAYNAGKTVFATKDTDEKYILNYFDNDCFYFSRCAGDENRVQTITIDSSGWNDLGEVAIDNIYWADYDFDNDTSNRSFPEIYAEYKKGKCVLLRAYNSGDESSTSSSQYVYILSHANYYEYGDNERDGSLTFTQMQYDGYRSIYCEYYYSNGNPSESWTVNNRNFVESSSLAWNYSGTARAVLKNSGSSISGNYSVAEGNSTTSVGECSHAEGKGHRSQSSYNISGAAGAITYTTSAAHGLKIGDIVAAGNTGNFRKVTAIPSATSFTVNSTFNQQFSISGKLYFTDGLAYGGGSHVEGRSSVASGLCSHAEGVGTQAIGDGSHAEGGDPDGALDDAYYPGGRAEGTGSHAEGVETIAKSFSSHAEGNGTVANGAYSHAEGYGYESSSSYNISGSANATTYTSNYDHGLIAGSIVRYGNVYRKVIAVPSSTSFTVNSTLSSTALSGVKIFVVKGVSYGESSHAEGAYTIAGGLRSHTEGGSTIAINDYEHAEGYFNKSNIGDTSSTKTRHSVGVGTSESDRKNAFEIMANGDTYLIGVGDYDGTNPSSATPINELIGGGSGAGATIITNDGSEGDSVAIKLTDNQSYQRSFRIDMTAEYSGGATEQRIGVLIVECRHDSDIISHGYYYGDVFTEILSEAAVYQDDTDPDTFYLMLRHNSDNDLITYAITPLDEGDVEAFITNAGDEHTLTDNCVINPIGDGIYLPLAGGTMSGNIQFPDSKGITNNSGDKYLEYHSGHAWLGTGKSYQNVVFRTGNTQSKVRILHNGTTYYDVLSTKDRVTSITSSSTDDQYPSAKAVYDLVGDIEAALDAILTSNNAAIEQELASI